MFPWAWVRDGRRWFDEEELQVLEGPSRFFGRRLGMGGRGTDKEEMEGTEGIITFPWAWVRDERRWFCMIRRKCKVLEGSSRFFGRGLGRGGSVSDKEEM